MMKQILLYVFLLFACSVNAEQFRITGTVVDENNVPAIGVSVVQQSNPNNGVHTDFDGNFSIEVEKGAILKFSYIGYDSKEVEVLNDSSLLIRLVPKGDFDDIDLELSFAVIRGCYPPINRDLPNTIDFLVSESKLKKRAQQRGDIEIFQLNDAQIEKANSLMAKELKKERYQYFHNLIPIDRYTKQYLGVKHKGHEKVLINFFSPGLETYLEDLRISKSPIPSDYGGNSLVRAVVDLTTEHTRLVLYP